MRLQTDPNRRDAARPASQILWRRAPGDDPGPGIDPAVLHDAGNAMTAAVLYAQVLRRHLSAGPCDDGESLDALQRIETNVVHAARLLEQGLRRGQERVCDVVALARQAAAQASPERANDVAVRWFGDVPPTGHWDTVAVARILANLLGNAAKYSAPGTAILVEVAPVDVGVEVVVRDRGIGVPEAAREAIFAGHRTAESREMAPGHGRGLRSSRWLAEQMGGRLWVAHEANGGSAFHLLLPSALPPESPTDAPDAGARRAAASAVPARRPGRGTKGVDR